MRFFLQKYCTVGTYFYAVHYACGHAARHGGHTEEEDACGVAAQIDFVEAVTDSWYLWYDEMTNVEKSDYASAQAYLDARLKPLLDDGRDRGFSYMTTITEDETTISSGAYVGFGFRTSSTATQIFIIDVFESGPAWAAGVRRGRRVRGARADRVRRRRDRRECLLHRRSALPTTPTTYPDSSLPALRPESCMMS